MEELQGFSPTSRQAKLDSLSRADIQKLAKEAGLKANGKTVDLVSNLLEKLSSTDVAPAADRFKESNLPAAAERSPPAPSQGRKTHNNTLPASESLTPSQVDATTAGNLSSLNLVQAAPSEAAALTPSRSCTTKQQDALPPPTTSTRGGSKRRNKGAKAAPTAKKPKAVNANAPAADSSGQEKAMTANAQAANSSRPEKAKEEVQPTAANVQAADSSGRENAKDEAQPTPAPSRPNRPGASGAAPTDAGAEAASTCMTPAASGQPEKGQQEAAQPVVTAAEPTASQPSFLPADKLQQEAASQPAVTATEPSASQPTAAAAAEQAAATPCPQVMNNLEKLPGAQPEAEEPPALHPEPAKPISQPASMPHKSIPETQEPHPSIPEPAEPVSQASVPHKSIAPVDPAASPIKPDTVLEVVSTENAARPAPACQTELLPALDAAPDASSLQASDPVDDWIVDPDEVAAAEADTQMTAADGSDMLSGVLGEEDSRVLSALLNAQLALPGSAHNIRSPAAEQPSGTGKQAHMGEGSEGLPPAEDMSDIGAVVDMEVSERGPTIVTAEAAGDVSDMGAIAGLEVMTQGTGAAGWVSNPMFEDPPEAVQQSAEQPVLRDGSADAEAAGKQVVAVGVGRPPSGRLRHSGVEGSGDLQKHAFERGRKSGIWHGATQVQLHQLENEWDSYKSCSTRGWTLPSMEDVQAESAKLSAAGFTTVDTPVLGRTSRNAILKRQGASKRKASEETDGSRPSSGKIARRSESQGAPNSPQRTHLRASRFGTKENAGVSTPSRLSHMTKGSQTPLKMDMGDSADSATPSHAARQEAGTPGGKAARAGASKASGQQQQQQNRAQKAEQQFAARRAAALAKVKK